MSKIAFHSNTTLKLTLEDDLQLAKETGFNGIVCTQTKINDYLKNNNQKQLKEYVKDIGVAIFGVSNISIDFTNPDEETITEIKRHSRLVRAMKGNFVSVTPKKINMKETDREKAVMVYAGNFAEMAEAASEYDVNLVIELERPENLLSSPVDMSYIISKSGRNNLGFALDTYALSVANVSIEEFQTIERDFYAVYLSDVPDKKRLAKSDRLPVGDGILDFEQIIKLIKSCDYRGVYTLKLFCDYRTKRRNRTLLRKARDNMKAYLNIAEYV